MLNTTLPTSVIQLNIFETCAFFLFVFHLTRVSHSNSWPGTASTIIKTDMFYMLFFKAVPIDFYTLIQAFWQLFYSPYLKVFSSVHTHSCVVILKLHSLEIKRKVT